MLSAQALIAAGVDPAVAHTYVAATAPASQGGNTGSADANNQGYTTSGPAQAGQSGSLNVPASEGGPAPNPPGTVATTTTANTDTPSTTPLDWKAYLADWGFPPDVVDELTKIFGTYTDPSQAQAAALGYIRGTQWYAQTFPGIQAGEKAGLFGDEAGYRQYVNDVTQTYRNYLGRDVTSNEVGTWLTQGVNANTVANHFQGQAQLAAEKNMDQYTLGAFDAQGRASDNDLSQYGDYLGGIGNQIGPQLSQRLNTARQRMADIFQGTLATPSMSLLSNGRPAAPSLGGGTSSQDVGA